MSKDPRSDLDLEALFARAREHRPNTTRAEFAFETRLAARLRAEPDLASIWAQVSWRLAPFFAAALVMLAVWQVELGSDVDDADALASADNAASIDPWSNLD